MSLTRYCEFSSLDDVLAYLETLPVKLDILQVEGQVKLSVALGVEIVVDRTLIRILLIVYGIHDAGPFLHGLRLISLKAPVTKRDEHGQLMTFTQIEITTRLSRL